MKKILFLMCASYFCYVMGMEDSSSEQTNVDRKVTIEHLVMLSCVPQIRVKEVCKKCANDFFQFKFTDQPFDAKTQKNIIELILGNLYYPQDKSHYEIARQLAKHMPVFKRITQLIKEAFNSRRSVNHAWFANTIKWIPAKQSTSTQIGYSGGLVTPLGLAIKKAHFNWAGRLIAEGADVNLSYPATHGATTYALYEAIDLKNKLAKANFFDSQKQHSSRRKQKAYDNIICLLLKSDADVNVYYQAGTVGSPTETPLQCAIRHEDSDSTQLLVAHNALDRLDKDVLNQREYQWLEATLQP